MPVNSLAELIVVDAFCPRIHRDEGIADDVVDKGASV